MHPYVLELWQAWCCDHFAGEPVPGTNHPLSAKVQSELPLTQLRSIASCPITGHQKGDQHLVLHCSPWGSCRPRWGHPPAFSSPSWTSQVTSAAPLKSLDRPPLDTLWCRSHIEVPKTAHSTQGGATPVQHRVGPSPPSLGETVPAVSAFPRTRDALVLDRFLQGWP